MVKDLGVFRHGIRQRHAAIDTADQVGDDHLEHLATSLVLDGRQRLSQRQAGIQHGRQLTSEDDQLFRADPLAQAGEKPLLAGRSHLQGN